MLIYSKKINIFIVLILVVSLADMVFAGGNYSYEQNYNSPVNNTNYQTVQYPQNNVLQGNVVMVPAGTEMKANVTVPLSSASLADGQSIVMSINNDFYYENKLVVPAGSTISGTVIQASSAKRAGINGKLFIRFNMITTPFGSQIPISAVIKTDDSSGLLVGGTKLDTTAEYAKDLAVGSAAGALSGLVFGSLASGDKLGRGAALGTAVGAGGGLLKSMWDKGNDVEIPAGSSIQLLLTQPITVSVPAYQFEN